MNTGLGGTGSRSRPMVSPGIKGVKPSESATYISTILISAVDFSP